MDTKTTNVGTVTLWKRIVKEMRDEHDRGDGHFSTEEVEMVESFVKGLPACNEILMNPDGCRECNELVVRDGKCEQHKIERRGRDRRHPRSTDTLPSCGNGACHVELEHGVSITRHHLHCDDRGPGWA